MNHALILSAQLALNGARRQTQLGPSYFRPVTDKAGKLWLEESYRIYNRALEKEDINEFLGPFTQEEYATLDFTKAIAAGTFRQE